MRAAARALHPLDRKLLRDLWRMRGQVLAVAMVMASGVAVLVMSLGALQSLRDTADAYYQRQYFAHVFSTLKRAPEHLTARIAEIPGVQVVQTRISKLALLDIDGFEEPVIGRLVSIPERGEPLLNRISLRSGRSVAPGRRDEAVVSESFAEAHGIRPGGHLRALINGVARRLDVVGIALSPEFVYAIGPGALMPDEKRFGVVWMGREALSAAYDLDGAFNDVALSLTRRAREGDVIERLDALLARYGGVGAYDRDDQISNWFLMNEIDQLANMATIMPTIFLAVAAFLTSMVLNRLIAIERAEIGLLKAFGYSNVSVGWHYVKLVLAIAAVGMALGCALGWWFGRVATGIYAEKLFHFPFFFFRPRPGVFVLATVVTLASSLLGALRAVRKAVALPPAEAMRPPAPPLYRATGVDSALTRSFDQPTRMILRTILRWPGRSLITTTGIAMGVALLVSSLHWNDAIDHLVQTYFVDAQRQDVSVGLIEPQSRFVTEAFENLPGVVHAEPARVVVARLRAGTRSHREAIQGIPADATLAPVYDSRGGVVTLPDEGLLVSSKLAEILAVSVGDPVTLEVLEGRRPTREVRVAGLFDTYIGTPAYMEIAALNRLMRERPSASLAHLVVDPEREAALYRALKEIPAISAVVIREAAVEKFYETMAETMLIFISFFASFACMLAFGVSYNSTRIALSERGRELATLRVLGLSPLEISYILLGEVGLLVLAGLPLGCLIGSGLAWFISDRFETELFRVPMVIEPSTFGLAVAIVVAATAVSALLVRRRLDRLDLIGVLKTRE